MAEPDASAPTVRLLRWGVLGGVALLALAQLATPFTGDQALFTVFGRQLAEGDALYLDLWDVKQPGLFWWYAAAGSVAGFGEVGIHLVEAICLVGFAAVLPRLLEGEVATRRAAVLAPAFTIGAFYLTAEPIDLTQAEVLGGPLIFVAAWLAAKARPEDRRRLVLAGVVVGSCAAVKLTLAPLAAVALLVPILVPFDGGPGLAGRVRRVVGWAALGFVAVAVLVATYLLATGALGEALDTWFRFTPTTTATAPPPWDRLVESVGRFVVRFAPLVVLALAGCTRLVRRRWGARPPRLLLAMAGWLVLVPPLFLVQHWWPYLLDVALIPLGVLAAEGFEVLCSWCRGERWRQAGAGLVLGAALVLTVGAAAGQWSALARHGFGVTADDRRALHEDLAPAYARGEAFAAEVDEPGPAFVLADPIVQLVSGRDLGIPTNGWSPEQLDVEHWQRVATELEDEQPPVLVIDEASHEIVAERASDVLVVIDDGWCEVGEADGDRWYLRRDLARCP